MHVTKPIERDRDIPLLVCQIDPVILGEKIAVKCTGIVLYRAVIVRGWPV